MRTLVSTVVIGICLAAAPALAQQHPWVPNGIHIGSLPNGSMARAYGRVHRGDIVDPARRPAAKAAADELHGDACNSRNAVFSCPGSP